MKIALSTDTSCAIDITLSKKLGINVFPLNVIVNGEEFLDGVSITQKELVEAMRGGKIIKTSTPPPGDIISYFEKIFDEGYDKIIHFTISSKLSSMNQLFNNVSRDSFDGRIIVVDSYSVCANMLSHILYTYEALREGKALEEILQHIEKRKENSFLTFIPENLTALKNGGRISPTVAALGNMIGLKPVLALKDGALEKSSMTRNVKKTITEQIETLSKTYPKEQYDYIIASFDGNESLISYFQEMIDKSLGGYEASVQPIAINVCAHCGPGTIGLLISPRINGHSINEYFEL